MRLGDSKMKAYLHRFIIFAITAFLVITPPITYAASPNGWAVSPADIIMNGATATVTAIKGAGSSALQSTVNHAPTVGNIGKKILKGAGGVAVAYAVTELIGAGVDWVLDPANNAIKYKDQAVVGGEASAGYSWRVDNFPKVPDKYPTPAALAAAIEVAACSGADLITCERTQFKRDGASRYVVSFKITRRGGVYTPFYNLDRVSDPSQTESGDGSDYKSIPISQVADKVISNAAAGHAPSQELIKTVIIDDVNAGALDTPLNINAVPKADAPAIPDPNAPPIDPTEPVPFDPSSIISAIKSVMAAVVNMSDVLGAKIDTLMIDLGLKHDEKLVADAANTAQIVAAIEAIEGNTLDGQVINDAVDRVIANDNARVGDIVAAIEAIEGNTLTGEVINDAIDRVIANDNANAQAANDVVSQSVDKAIDAADAASQAQVDAIADSSSAVVDAIDAQTGAITQTDPETGDISLKFPTFCGWAGTVCDLADWVMADDTTMEDTPVPVSETVIDQPSSFDKPYISAPSQCPPDVEKNIPIGSNSFNFVIPMTPVCDFGANVISPVLYFIALLQAAFIIGSAFKVG